MQMQLILLANIILSIGAIVGISVFASQTGDIFISSDTYGFYWFVSTFSLLTGIVGYCYHKIDYVKQQFPKSEYIIYGMGLISLLFTVFWLAASASMTSVLRNCLQIKNLKYPEYIDDDQTGSVIYFYYDYNYTCNGEIITTTFGYSLFILWCVVSYIVVMKLFSRLQTTQNPASLETPQEQVHTVQTTNEYWVSSTYQNKTSQETQPVQQQTTVQQQEQETQPEEDQIQIEPVQTPQETQQEEDQIQIEPVQTEYQQSELIYTDIVQV
jgi:hypothetical protein